MCHLLIAVVLLLATGSAFAQEATFRTTYSGALFVTPINTNALFLPHPEFQPVFSGSIEYSFPKTGRLGFEFSGGYYPYANRDEIIARFGIRRFAKPSAPAGAYWEMTAIGGVTTPHEGGAGAALHAIQPEPLFGTGLRIGSVRQSRFGDFAFEYGAGPSLILTGGQTQIRAEFYFGMGFLLGREERIEQSEPGLH